MMIINESSNFPWTGTLSCVTFIISIGLLLDVSQLVCPAPIARSVRVSFSLFLETVHSFLIKHNSCYSKFSH